jgi:hypothetical protein
MEQHLIDENETNPVIKRPVFLTVLCILTWTGSGLAFAIGVFQFMAFSSLRNNMAFDGIDSGFNRILWGAIITCVCALICAGAAIVMWKRRKWGFYIYTVFELIPPVYAAYNSLNHLSMDPFRLVLTGLSLLFPIGFVVMYALNLKYMRR